MKEIVFTSFALFFFVGCSDRHERNIGIDSIDANEKDIIEGVHYSIIVIDGCEYIFGKDDGGYNGGYFLSHKGNCKNKIHQPPAGSP